MNDIVINGRVLLLPTNGIPRYAGEIVGYLDQNMPDDYKIDLVVPEGSRINKSYDRIRVVRLKKSPAWDYLQAEKYAKKKNALYINLASKGVIYRKSIATIFDIRPLSYDPKPSDLKALRYYLKFRLSFSLAKKNAAHIVTISEFCKKELIEIGKCRNKNISIIGCGWNHIQNVEEDNSIFDEYPAIIKKEYYLSIGSVAPHKNFNWIIENAKYNKESNYIIIGKTDPSLWEDTTENFLGRIHYLGYQSDGKVLALLKNAKALIFPSFYEGFGIPPLEALSCGIPAVVSDIEVMREVFGKSVHYINPYDAKVNLNQILEEPVDNSDKVLAKYSWDKAGEKWIKLICENYR